MEILTPRLRLYRDVGLSIHHMALIGEGCAMVSEGGG